MTSGPSTGLSRSYTKPPIRIVYLHVDQGGRLYVFTGIMTCVRREFKTTVLKLHTSGSTVQPYIMYLREKGEHLKWTVWHETRSQ